jgi:hypothetical protein
MGGRITFASSKTVDYVYKTVGYREGVKILIGTANRHQLPEESHTSTAYIKLQPNGDFSMMRIYDENHYLRIEIGFHREPDLDKSYKPILHIHEQAPDDFAHRGKRLLTQEEYNKYRKYLGGDYRWKPEM